MVLAEFIMYCSGNEIGTLYCNEKVLKSSIKINKNSLLILSKHVLTRRRNKIYIQLLLNCI